MGIFSKLSGKDRKENTNQNVKFVKKYTDQNGTYYEIYKCDDQETAKDFLAAKKVDKGLHYLIVETPTGNWGLDIKGLYKEYLLPWQKDVNQADTVGSAIGIPDEYSLEMAARGVNVSFIVKVSCGNCSHEWTEALSYQNWTVVECPKCGKKNKVDSKNYSVWLVKP